MRSTSSPSKQQRVGRHRDRGCPRDAIATAAAASQRSCASMKRSRSARSSALGSPADHFVAPRGQVLLHRRPGPLERAVGRGDAGLEQATPSPPAGQPSTSRGDQRRPLARRQHLQRGEEGQLDRLALDDDRVRLVVGRRDLVEQPVRVRLQPRHLGERVQRRARAGTCAGARPGRRSSRSGRARRGTACCPRSVSRLRHARRNVSCTASSASSNEASIR